MLLEDALEKYPFETKLRDGTSVTVRRSPGAMTENSTSFSWRCRGGAVVHQATHHRPDLVPPVVRQPDFERNLPLLMLHKNKVIGEATLHQRGGGWKRHIGFDHAAHASGVSRAGRIKSAGD